MRMKTIEKSAAKEFIDCVFTVQASRRIWSRAIMPTTTQFGRMPLHIGEQRVSSASRAANDSATIAAAMTFSMPHLAFDTQIDSSFLSICYSVAGRRRLSPRPP